jgi:hypothetical protein
MGLAGLLMDFGDTLPFRNIGNGSPSQGLIR